MTAAVQLVDRLSNPIWKKATRLKYNCFELFFYHHNNKETVFIFNWASSLRKWDKQKYDKCWINSNFQIVFLPFYRSCARNLASFLIKIVSFLPQRAKLFYYSTTQIASVFTFFESDNRASLLSWHTSFAAFLKVHLHLLMLEVISQTRP